MTTATKFTLSDALKLVGVTQLAAAMRTDDTYEGIESYAHFGFTDLSASTDSYWLMCRLSSAKLRADDKWTCQIGLYYIRSQKGNKFTALRPQSGQNDPTMFKNLNSLDVLVEDLFAMEFLNVDHQTLIEEWLASGVKNLQLAPASVDSFLDIVPQERIVPAKKQDKTINDNAGSPANNPIGFNTFYGVGFVPVAAVNRAVMGGKKLSGPKVTIGGAAKPNPVVAPAVADAPIAPAIAPAAIAPAAPSSNERAELIKTLKDLGFSLKEIMQELPHLFVSAAPAAPAPIVESDDEYGDMPL